ncbi:MAG TPA: carbon starvation CstA family protein [Candidatus Methanomethylicus sp.]|nr:carbon starvation CstA family protein [Candidatus Methanomethylicus sp.]
MTTTYLIVIGLAFWLFGIFVVSKRLEKSYFVPDPGRKTPAVAFRDDFDFYPANPVSLFGDHWAATAGGAPLSGGVAIAQWGWASGIIYVLPVNILLGSVHDFATGFVMMRQRGQTASEVSYRWITPLSGLLFSLIGYVAILSFCAAFARLVVSGATSTPQLFVPIMLLAVIGPPSGFLLYRKGWPIWLVGLIQFVIFIGALWVGFMYPFSLQVELWYVFLVVVGVLAACLPNWLYSEPSNFMMFLYMALGVAIIFICGLVANMPITDFPALIFYDKTLTPSGWFYPGIAMMVSCGALTGMHVFWIGAYTCKRFPEEKYVRIIGYGGEVLESVGLWTAYLAMLVLPITTYLPALKAGWTQAYGIGFSKIVGAVIPGISPQALTVFGMWIAIVFIMSTFYSGFRNMRVIGLEFVQLLTKRKITKHVNASRWLAAIITGVLMVGLALSGAYLQIWALFPILSTALAVFSFIIVAEWCRIRGKKSTIWIAAAFVTLCFIALPASIYGAWWNYSAGAVIPGTVSLFAAIITLVYVEEWIRRRRHGYTPEEKEQFLKYEEF